LPTLKTKLTKKQSAEELRDRFKKDPEFFVSEILGITKIWQGQVDILNAIRDHWKVVVPSGHALGKDYIASAVALWFLYSHYPSKVILTAPSQRQVKDIMWMELSSRYKNAKVKLDGDLMSLKLMLDHDWFVEGFTTKEVNQSVGKFQGYHSPNILIIISEAQAVEELIFDQAEAIMTSQNSRMLVIGNPIQSTGRFAQMIKDTTHHKVLELSCLDSPNVIEGREVIPGLVSRAWVEEKRVKWNKDGSNKDPRWMGRVLGKVPTTSVNTVVSEDLYRRCIDRQIVQPVLRGSIGVDPARFGDDDMIISAFECGTLIDEKTIPKCDAVEGAGEIAIMQKKHFPQGQCAIVVDCDGLGGPYLDFAKKMIPDTIDIQWVEFHGSATNDQEVGLEYQNLRAEAAFYARELMEQGLISLNDNEVALEEGTGEQYFVNQRGKIQIEDKDDIKERLGRSPNVWDARKLAIWGIKFAPVIRKIDMYNRRERKSSMVPSTMSYMGA
jgi:phage terminase large subunit